MPAALVEAPQITGASRVEIMSVRIDLNAARLCGNGYKRLALLFAERRR